MIGFVLGKFMPPTAGHVALFDFARGLVDRLYILVCSTPQEPIDGALRAAWVRELEPGCVVVHMHRDIPQTPEEHPDFWAIWRAAIREHVPEPIHRVFASEPYGHRLALELGAEFWPWDLARQQVPISASAVRADPMRCWGHIPPPVRPYFVRRVCVFGPESTGKTTLTRQLAARYHTVGVEEYARGLLDLQDGVCTPADIPRIAAGQRAAEAALARQANRVLICDTDLLTTVIWSEVLFGACPDDLRAAAAQARYDLTLLLEPDVPWVDDQQRYLPHARQDFLRRCEAALRGQGRTWTRVYGSWAQRFDRATAAVDALLSAPAGP